MKYTTIFLFTMFSCLLSFCSSIKDGKTTIKQGVFGKVLWTQGNHMPSPDKPAPKNGIPAIRTIYIYSLTKLSQTEGQAPLFSKINTTLAAKVKTDKNGFYQCKLKPGSYSVFTLEDDGHYFANLFDGNGNIASFEVMANKVTTYDIRINYKAAY